MKPCAYKTYYNHFHCNGRNVVAFLLATATRSVIRLMIYCTFIRNRIASSLTHNFQNNNCFGSAAVIDLLSNCRHTCIHHTGRDSLWFWMNVILPNGNERARFRFNLIWLKFMFRVLKCRIIGQCIKLSLIDSKYTVTVKWKNSIGRCDSMYQNEMQTKKQQQHKCRLIQMAYWCVCCVYYWKKNVDFCLYYPAHTLWKRKRTDCFQDSRKCVCESVCVSVNIFNTFYSHCCCVF